MIISSKRTSFCLEKAGLVVTYNFLFVSCRFGCQSFLLCYYSFYLKILPLGVCCFLFYRILFVEAAIINNCCIFFKLPLPLRLLLLLIDLLMGFFFCFSYYICFFLRLFCSLSNAASSLTRIIITIILRLYDWKTHTHAHTHTFLYFCCILFCFSFAQRLAVGLSFMFTFGFLGCTKFSISLSCGFLCFPCGDAGVDVAAGCAAPSCRCCFSFCCFLACFPHFS